MNRYKNYKGKKVCFLIANIIIGTFLFAVRAQEVSKNSTPQLSEYNVIEVIASMTLEEKASIVIGGGRMVGEEFENGMIGEMDGIVPGAAGSINSIPHLGIPITILADGPTGVRIHPIRNNDSTKTYYGTSFPVPTMMASSWDVNLMQEVGTALGSEFKHYGVDVALAPAFNIIRNPLNGRNGEYYSEDPYLSGKLAASMVHGIQSTGVGATVKHFVANNQETNRRKVDAVISERALREIYLKTFRIAIKESNPWAVMTAYNKVNGVYTPESYDLNTKILREDWGYNGFVMTDWRAGKDIIAQLKAGNDLIEPGFEKQKAEVVEAVKSGELDEEILNQNVERILKGITKTLRFNGYKNDDNPDLEAHAKLCKRAAEESIVLLKNNTQTLPLQKGKKIALFGNTSYDTFINNNGSSDVSFAYNISIYEGLVNSGFTVHQELKAEYDTYIENDRIAFPAKNSFGKVRLRPEFIAPKELIEKCALETDVAIVSIGRNSGEAADRELEGDYKLTEAELSQLKNITNIFHQQGKKVIFLMNVGGVIETASWKDLPDAILMVWQPGQEGGNAIANVISGKVNPSGKLPVTFPVKYEDVASSKNFPGTPARRPKQVIHEEGIYVGYRYFNSFNVKPSYEFGYGLSYTNFEYSALKLSKSKFKDSIDLEFTITNIGEKAGREVAQLYLSTPSGKLDKPSEELRKFAKTRLLQPGEKQIVKFTLNKMDLASFDSQNSQWIAESGEYKVNIGASSMDFRLSEIFKVKKEIEVEKVNKVLEPLIEIEELTR
ncbi:beta-glucosidase [Plebeiibacterium marinum]|uniref:Glycoside hydrolase family 3 C-terminal domain-containing protein n=1 Tax=Plebeiibacterium marinum TaxID=2992111 RepID=A0AAE3MAZ7_9BACT|nr:glycoside hydrolase family 3 C-terminal domain-containing protein [Plebeiobacterium marinum]MCW3804516.1 glycoside hydrolase family 3 C-terminal domain-containing protein [Plebeiobacterium marinum]